MPQSKTRLMHTCPTEVPFDCMPGDFSDQGFLVVVDKRTHELVVREGAEAGTISVIVNPKGVQVQGPGQAEPFHISEAELAETRARLKREAEANRPRYQAQDAALAGLTKDEYRALVEAVLAGHIDDAAKAADPADPEEAELLRYEINGLCIALRLLGGYEVPQPDKGTERVAFDLDWARSIPPASFDWRGFLGYAGAGEVAGEPGPKPARGGAIGAPRGSKGRVLSESED